MFHLVLTTCFAGVLCYGGEPEVGYATAERCLEEGAILTGAPRSRPHATSRIVCAAEDGAETAIYIGYARLPPQRFPDDSPSVPAID